MHDESDGVGDGVGFGDDDRVGDRVGNDEGDDVSDSNGESDDGDCSAVGDIDAGNEDNSGDVVVNDCVGVNVGDDDTPAGDTDDSADGVGSGASGGAGDGSDEVGTVTGTSIGANDIEGVSVSMSKFVVVLTSVIVKVLV